jgi:hypothetical protein
VALTKVTLLASIPPSEKVVADKKPVPETDTGVPPRVDPVAGEIPVTVAGGAGTSFITKALPLGFPS